MLWCQMSWAWQPKQHNEQSQQARGDVWFFSGKFCAHSPWKSLLNVGSSAETLAQRNRALLWLWAVRIPYLMRNTLSNFELQSGILKGGGGTLTRGNDIRVSPGMTGTVTSAPCAPPVYDSVTQLLRRFGSSLQEGGDVAFA